MESSNLTVITTVFNAQRYIIDSFNSIISQSLNSFEWIIVDDGSKDSSSIIINEFISNNKKVIQDKNIDIVFIQDKNNIRIPRQRNKAISLSSGKYIAIHDADDISLSSRLEDELSYLNSNDDIFCVGSHAIKIDGSGKEIGFMDYPPLGIANVEDAISKQNKNPIIDPSCMFRKEDFEKLGGYTLDRSIYTVPDFDLWCRAILSGLKINNIGKKLIKYRINPNGMTQKHKKEMINAHHIVHNNFMRKYKKQKH